MDVNVKMSLSEDQHAFVRGLVGTGRFPSVDEVIPASLIALREQEDAAEREALRTLIARRRKGPFIDMDESRARTEAQIARRRSRFAG